MSRLKKSQQNGVSSISQTTSSSTSCPTSNPEFTVSVVGVSGAHEQKRAKLDQGVGKSSLCSRFVSPCEGEYDEKHSSEICPADFCSATVVKYEHWLYWGHRDLDIPPSETNRAQNGQVHFHVIEQTEFCDDRTYFPHGISSNNNNNNIHHPAMGAASSTAASPYLQRCLQTSLESLEKHVYRHSAQLHLEDSRDHMFGMAPGPVLTVQGIVFVYDISPFLKKSHNHSQEDVQLRYLLEILRLLSKAKRPLPLVVALCKSDLLISPHSDMMTREAQDEATNIIRERREIILKAVQLNSHIPPSSLSSNAKASNKQPFLSVAVLPILACSARDNIQVDLVFRELYRLAMCLEEAGVGNKSKRKPLEGVKKYLPSKDDFVEECEKLHQSVKSARCTMRLWMKPILQPHVHEVLLLRVNAWRSLVDHESTAQHDFSSLPLPDTILDQLKKLSMATLSLRECDCVQEAEKLLQELVDERYAADKSKFRRWLKQYSENFAPLENGGLTVDSEMMRDEDEDRIVDTMLSQIRLSPHFETHFHVADGVSSPSAERIPWFWLEPTSRKHLVSKRARRMFAEFRKELWEHARVSDLARRRHLAENVVRQFLWANRYPAGLAFRPGSHVSVLTQAVLEVAAQAQLACDVVHKICDTFLKEVEDLCLQEFVDLLWENIALEENGMLEDPRYRALQFMPDQRDEMLHWMRNPQATNHFCCPFARLQGCCVDKTVASSLNSAYRTWLLTMKNRSKEIPLYVWDSSATTNTSWNRWNLAFQQAKRMLEDDAGMGKAVCSVKPEQISSLKEMLVRDWPHHPSAVLLILYSSDKDLLALKEQLADAPRRSPSCFVSQYRLCVLGTVYPAPLLSLDTTNTSTEGGSALMDTVKSLLHGIFSEVLEIFPQTPFSSSSSSSTVSNVEDDAMHHAANVDMAQQLLASLVEFIPRPGSGMLPSNEASFKRTSPPPPTLAASAALPSNSVLRVHVVCFCSTSVNQTAPRISLPDSVVTDLLGLVCGGEHVWSMVCRDAESYMRCQAYQLTLVWHPAQIAMLDQIILVGDHHTSGLRVEMVFRSYHAEMVDIRCRRYADAYILLHHAQHRASECAAKYFQRQLQTHCRSNAQNSNALVLGVLMLDVGDGDSTDRRMPFDQQQQQHEGSSCPGTKSQRSQLLHFMKETWEQFHTIIIQSRLSMYPTQTGLSMLHSKQGETSVPSISYLNYPPGTSARKLSSHTALPLPPVQHNMRIRYLHDNVEMTSLQVANKTTCVMDSVGPSDTIQQKLLPSGGDNVDVEVDLIYSIPLPPTKRSPRTLAISMKGCLSALQNGEKVEVTPSEEEEELHAEEGRMKKVNEETVPDANDEEPVYCSLNMSDTKRPSLSQQLESISLPQKSTRAEDCFPVPFFKTMKPLPVLPTSNVTLRSSFGPMESIHLEEFDEPQGMGFADRRRWLSGPVGNAAAHLNPQFESGDISPSKKTNVLPTVVSDAPQTATPSSKSRNFSSFRFSRKQSTGTPATSPQSSSSGATMPSRSTPVADTPSSSSSLHNTLLSWPPWKKKTKEPPAAVSTVTVTSPPTPPPGPGANSGTNSQLSFSKKRQQQPLPATPQCAEMEVDVQTRVNVVADLVPAYCRQQEMKQWTSSLKYGKPESPRQQICSVESPSRIAPTSSTPPINNRSHVVLSPTPQPSASSWHHMQQLQCLMRNVEQRPHLVNHIVCRRRGFHHQQQMLCFHNASSASRVNSVQVKEVDEEQEENAVFMESATPSSVPSASLLPRRLLRSGPGDGQVAHAGPLSEHQSSQHPSQPTLLLVQVPSTGEGPSAGMSPLSAPPLQFVPTEPPYNCTPDNSEPSLSDNMSEVVAQLHQVQCLARDWLREICTPSSGGLPVVHALIRYVNNSSLSWDSVWDALAFYSSGERDEQEWSRCQDAREEALHVLAACLDLLTEAEKQWCREVLGHLTRLVEQGTELTFVALDWLPIFMPADASAAPITEVHLLTLVRCLITTFHTLFHPLL